MREIKFRVWSKIKNTWLKSIVISDDGTPLVFFVEIDDKQNIINKVFTLESFEPVVLQFIGIQDKNGKDIYEGDYLRGQDYEFPVEVINEHGAFGLKYSNRNLYFCEHGSAKQIQMTIVGNIFEKPESLK